ncbi:MAG TPA: glycerate kinase [Dehalococcoidia bacterium]|nr:glycerate kinase [Dehalococcoidia bacterium]
MRIMIAPQELKGSLRAAEAAAAIADGLQRALPAAEFDLLPLADGGPGTLDALLAARGGEARTARVSGPLAGAKVEARFGVFAGGMALIETAEANGLALLTRLGLAQDPAQATTRGVGELIGVALDAGCRRFLLGIGGSATNDGGAGMAQALGFRLLDAHGQELAPGAAPLARLDRIEAGGADPRLAACAFEVAVDVQNPLCGPQGATAVYGPQKGVRPEQVADLDAALRRLGETIARDLGRDVLELPGAGAAGGLGAGLVGFLGARLRPGFQIVAEAVELEAHARAADLIVTGEGRLDGQTPFGKTIAGLAAVARRHGKPVIALVGGIAADFKPETVPGLTAAFALTSRPLSLDEAQAEARRLLAAVAEQVGQVIAALG